MQTVLAALRRGIRSNEGRVLSPAETRRLVALVDAARQEVDVIAALADGIPYGAGDPVDALEARP